MGQSNLIFFFLFAAFFVFITVRGELPKYMGFLLSSPQAPPQLATSGQIAAQLAYSGQSNSTLSSLASPVASAAASFLAGV